MKSSSLLIFFAIGALLANAQEKPSVAREYKKIFTTYPFGDPDPVPKPAGKIYPYFRFDSFTDKPVQKEWTVVELENDYIKLMILPEVGGKIWSATEKSTGKDFIYHNHVIKFRDVAMRGPWTCGGIEANYGIVGHTPNCATPVDYTILKKEDGSVSCVIGVFDLLSRTSWRLDINLPKDKAYFTTSSFWFNSTPFNEPYYTWMNTGIKAAGNLQFIFPGNRYLGHEGEYSNWPINQQNHRDLSFYNNNDFGGYKSYHVFGKYNDFFGGYWHDDEFGMGRYATHDDKPGKKIWIWGLSQQGMIWEKLLTDTDGQYVEVQSGRLFNQSAENSIYTPFKHRSFAPYQSDAWTEYWFPVKQTKGFVKANDYGAVNLKYENGWVKIYFSPLQTLHEKLELKEGDKLIYSKNISATPMVLFVDSIKAAVDTNNLQISLGVDKLNWSSSPQAEDLKRPVDLPKDFDNNSANGLYLQGKNYISFRDYTTAREKLDACLQKDPYLLPALCDLASLQIRDLQYDSALITASKALSIDTYDPAANYYYALANRFLGKVTDAKDGFDIAAADLSFRSAAYTELSKLYLRDKDTTNALAYAQKCLVNNETNMDGLQLLAVLYRLQHHEKKAAAVLDKIVAFDPLSHFAQFERFLLDHSNESKLRFTANVRNELPQQTFLELAIWYQQLNCTEEALQVLACAAPCPEIIYWQAYLQNKPVQLGPLQPGLNFPFRSETAEVLESLIKKNDQWLLKYHLALIEWNRNHFAIAKQLMSACGDQPVDAAFYAARAALQKDDATAALTDLQKAISLDSTDKRYHKLLAEHFIRQQEYEKALALTEPFYAKHPDDYVTGMLYAKILLLNKKYAATDALLTHLQILPFEGATEGRQLYHEAKLMQAVAGIKAKQYKSALKFTASARLWPQNLGVGKPYDDQIDERLENWLDYLCYSGTGNRSAADAALKKIIAFTPMIDNTVPNFLAANHLVSAWALEKAVSNARAEEWLQAQAASYPDNKNIRWSLQVFEKKAPLSESDAKNAEVHVLEALLK